MDDEQRKYFADMMATMEGVASDARAAASTSRETQATVRKLDARVGNVEGAVTVLQKHVFGSDPPPSPPVRPLAESVGDHEGEIATLEGQVIAARAEIKTAVEKIDALAARPETAQVVIAAMKDAAEKPAVQRLGTAMAGLLLVAIAVLTASLQQRMAHLEEKPATVQPAPTVYIPLPVGPDGGAK